MELYSTTLALIISSGFSLNLPTGNVLFDFEVSSSTIKIDLLIKIFKALYLQTYQFNNKVKYYVLLI
jgi:hypothetical protein